MVCAVTGYTVFSMYTVIRDESITNIIYMIVVTFTTVGFGDVIFNRNQFAENFIILMLAHQIMFVVSFAMVASCITAITEMISNQSNENKHIENNNVQTDLAVDKKKKTKDVVIRNIETS